jgi:hypothetical protein
LSVFDETRKKVTGETRSVSKPKDAAPEEKEGKARFLAWLEMTQTKG